MTQSELTERLLVEFLDWTAEQACIAAERICQAAFEAEVMADIDALPVCV